MAPSPPRRRTPYPPGLKLGTYNIWDGQVFGLPQAIWAVHLGNYNLMLLTEMKILDKA